MTTAKKNQRQQTNIGCGYLASSLEQMGKEQLYLTIDVNVLLTNCSLSHLHHSKN